MLSASNATLAQAPASLIVTDPPTGSSRRSLLAWSLLTSSLFVGGGALRLFGSAAAQAGDLTATSPFVLDLIPKSLDGWTYVEGTEVHLDQPTTRITGSTDHVIRSYFDEMTGTTLSVLVLYGPAEPVLPHTPQVCFPASGYRSLGEPVDRSIMIDDHLSAVFRSAFFTKSGGRSSIRSSVYHSYRLDGVWSPTVTTRSLPRRQAGLFKVQIQRRILDNERMESDEPIESFVRHLLPVLEQMIASAGQTSSPPTPPTDPAASTRSARP